MGCHFPPPGDLPDPEIEPVSPVSPAFEADLYLLSHWESPTYHKKWVINAAGVPLYVPSHFSFLFSRFLFLSFSLSTMMYFYMDLFALIMLRVHWASWAFRWIFLLSVGKVSGIIALNILLSFFLLILKTQLLSTSVPNWILETEFWVK